MKMATRTGKENEEYEEDSFCTPILLCVEEPDLMKPMDEEIWQSEQRPKE